MCGVKSFTGGFDSHRLRSPPWQGFPQGGANGVWLCNWEGVG
ncbi:hypothetical protein CLOSTASPAR_01944 [[Clostridium] asparagiforme DSM 15981]|uniref:Uncharacterized protein n=1 Tax=[Clostridium] asparagiforme DSM 15981 TaxID=518636 RepID=C0CY68_9FIRM|nr:hypothetical protein CLOSTASPAR_01944 [[Clostridium] asparagiforme DSM 15981]